MHFLWRKRKIGLVLSSGAAKGLAHIGVIKALEERKVHIDFIAGSSIGALVGACYAKNRSIVEFEEVVLKTDWRRLLQLADFNLALLFKGFVQGQKVRELLKTIIGDVRFKDLKIPLAVMATDLDSGEGVVIKDGSVLDAVMASISIPVVFTPLKYNGRFLVDGGIINPVPIKLAREMGANYIIASNAVQVSKKIKSRRENKAKPKPAPVLATENLPAAKTGLIAAFNHQIDMLTRDSSGGPLKALRGFMESLQQAKPAPIREVDIDTPGIFNVLAQAINYMEYQIGQRQMPEADIAISPDVGHIDTLEFFRGKEAIDKGYAAAKAALAGIRL